MSEPATAARLALPDALRGIAALAVVCFHLYVQNLVPAARAPLPEPVHAVLSHGYLGVYVFFVLSGYVIALSVDGATVTGRYLGRFALRRSIRLDPPYWVAIAAAVAIAAVARRPEVPVPDVGNVVAHVFYAQTFFEYPAILGVFWTLCLEIQFYLVFVAILLFGQRLLPSRARWLFVPLFVLGVAASVGAIDLGMALFVWAWPFFFLGVVTAWHLRGRVSTAGWVAVAIGASVIFAAHPDRVGAALGTALTLFLAGRARRADGVRWVEAATLGRGLQYLGRISYSLYLTHLLVVTKALRVLLRAVGGGPLGPGQVIGLLLAGIALSIVVAHLFYVLVERPAQRWSRRVRLTSLAGR